MNRVLILMYHQVDTPISVQEQRFCTPPADFNTQMAWLKQSGYRTVGLGDIVGHVEGKAPLTGKAVHITFDDGFVGVLEHALPVLKQHEIPATLFALPGRVGATNDWMTGRHFPRRAILSGSQLRLLLDAGITIGSHTSSHVRLPDIPASEAEQEIMSSKKALEDMLGRAVEYFAYPFGLFNEEVRKMVVQAGYRGACSTRSGFNRPGEDPYLLRRIDVFGTDRLWQFRQKLQYGTSEASRMQLVRYYSGRLMARLGHN